MTPVFCCGFECGITAAHWTVAGGGSFSTGTVRGDLRSARVNLAASSGSANLSTGTVLSSNIGVFRFYVNFTTLPNTDFPIFLEVDTLGSAQVGIIFKSSDGKLYAGRDNNGTMTLGATGVTVTTGQWYCCDLQTDIHANPWLIDAKVNGVALGQASIALAAGTLGSLRIGRNYAGVFTTTVDMFIDDVVASVTTADYPIGEGKVLGFVPAADGTHTFTTTHAILGTTGAPTTGGNITSATTTAFGYVNARPIGGGVADATRLWNQATAAATEYAEVTIEQTTETSPPRAVEVLCIARETSTTGCNSTFKINDNGTESTVYAMTTPAGNVDEFKTKQFATPPTAGSTIDSFGEATRDNAILLGNLTPPFTAAGQSFTAIACILGSATFFLAKTASPSGNMVAKLYASTGTHGTNAMPTGAALAVSDAIDASTLTTTYTLTTFPFTGANRIALTNGTVYIIVIECLTVDNTNKVNVGCDSSGPSHAGNYCTYQSSWTAGATTDLCFYVKTTPDWTLSTGAGNFKNLRLRFGYSSDATPDVYCRGWMVEAEFPVIATPSTIPNKIFSTMQAVTRSNYY